MNVKTAFSLLLFLFSQNHKTVHWSLQGWSGKKTFANDVGNIPLSFSVVSGSNPQVCCSTASAGISYLTLPFSANLNPATQLVFSFHVQTTGSPIFGVNLQTENQSQNCYPPPTGGGYPAIVVPLLWRTGSLDNQFSRWWARDYRVQLNSGTYQVTVPMAGSNWMSVYGVWGNQAPLEFSDALANMYAIGLTFGGGCYLAHGVNVQTGTGTATFFLDSYSFQ